VTRRWMAGLVALAGLLPAGARAVAPSGDPVADRFSFPVGALPNSPTTSRYQAPTGHLYLGWAVHPAASFLSPAYGVELQPGEDWGGRGGGDTDLGQPVYAAAAGTIVAAGNYGPRWGNIMLIRHTLPGGLVVLTQYAYMADIAKKSGPVEWREVIGHVGKGAGGSVLHFEVRRDNMIEAPPDYWPSADGRDSDWVRAHYFSPSQFVRTHYRVLVPAAPPSGEPGPPGENPGSNSGSGGSGPSPGAPGPGSTPGTVTPPGGLNLPPFGPGPAPSTPPSVQPVWDGVPHLDGSVLKNAAGTHYLLRNGVKWPIPSSEVLATWIHPEEALPASDQELASYKDAPHPLGLRSGVPFKVPNGPFCLSDDPFDSPGLAFWVFDSEQQFIARGYSRNQALSLPAQALSLYIRPTPFRQTSSLPRGTLIKKAYGGYYVMDELQSFYTGVHPVTSPTALHSWQMTESQAVEVSSESFWDRTLRMEPLRFRPGSIVQSAAGQIFIVSGEYKHLVPTMDVFHRRGYKESNIIAATDAELALHKDWPTPLR
jgi:murein DD-endopeptidase MepM/ murein hydrolase activator NlpD